MTGLNDTDLIRREQAWHRRSSRLIIAGGLGGGLLILLPLILVIRSFPSLSAWRIVLVAVLGAAAFGVPYALWIDWQRRRQPAAIFGRRAALLQLDRLQGRYASALKTAIVTGLINACLQEKAVYALGFADHGATIRGLDWLILAATTASSLITAWRFMQPGYAAGLIHPHAALAMTEERMLALRHAALSRAYPILACLLALTSGAIIIRPPIGPYLLPAMLLLAVTLPPALLLAAEQGNAEDS